MKMLLLYAVPVIWTIMGILYARSLPKDGFSGVGEIFLTLAIGIILLTIVVFVHINKLKKMNHSDKK